jgi:hypothetical protein
VRNPEHDATRSKDQDTPMNRRGVLDSENDLRKVSVSIVAREMTALIQICGSRSMRVPLCSPAPREQMAMPKHSNL